MICFNAPILNSLQAMTKPVKASSLPMIILGGLICVAALALGLWFGSQEESSQPLGKAIIISPMTTQLSPAKILSDFTLTDHQQKPLTRESLKNHWSLVFFGYANCPDVCPTTLSVLKNSLSRMQELDADMKLPQVIFISVDPQRDTPEFLAPYIQFFSSHFIAATGTESELLKITREMGIIYMKTGNINSDDYLVDHSASILLLNRDANLAAILSAPHNSEQLSADIMKIISKG